MYLVNIVCDTDGIVKLAEAKRLGSLYLRLLAKQMKRTYGIKVIIEALLSLTCIINWSKYFSWHNVQQWCRLIGVLFLYHYACSVWPMWAHERCELMPWWSDTLIYEKCKCYLKMWMFSAFYTIYCLNQMFFKIIIIPPSSITNAVWKPPVTMTAAVVKAQL